MAKKDIDFHNVDFEGFRKFATDNKLTRNEKVACPDVYREGKDKLIINDIITKLPALKQQRLVFADIGCGCSPLRELISHLCQQNNNRLLLIDSREMLELAPQGEHIEQFAGEFPYGLDPLFEKYTGQLAGVICYSVIQYPFAAGKHWDFIDGAIQLLDHQGICLLADIPNREFRRRFFESPAGLESHRKFTGRKDNPLIEPIQPGEITDKFVIETLDRYRQKGYNAFVIPQPHNLPMGNRREDIIIMRP